MRSLIVTLIVALALCGSVLSFNPAEYLCSICLISAEHFGNDYQSASLMAGCTKQFSEADCLMYFKDKDFSPKKAITATTPREYCQQIDLCTSKVEAWQKYALANADSNVLDVKVSKAMGSRGYDKVRISVVSNSTIQSSTYTYSSQFKYRWTNKYLSTGIVSVKPGVKTSINVAPGQNIDVFIPTEGAGVRGVIIADPCFQSQWIYCGYQDKFSTFDHTTELLNAINGHDDVQYWQILGDNFYDQAGDATSTWFSALSTASKSKIFATVPGNHDFWVNASPYLWVPKDQLGNGYYQYYGQDVISSTATTPYDFSVNPDDKNKGGFNLSPASNYFYYNKLGNVGFIGYSGAHTYADMSAHFTEACTWASNANLDALLLLGHWNSDGDGCETEATVPALYKELTSLPACQPVAAKMRYFMGHKHCNIITEPDIGFMVGAMGMRDSSSCGGVFGIPVVDTTGGTFKVYYFPIAEVDKFDNYDVILSCIKANGVSGCYHLATLWANTPL